MIENLIRYISAIDFKLERIKLLMCKLGPYFMISFDDQFFLSKNDAENVLTLP